MTQRACFLSNKIITVQESDEIQDAIEEAENKVVRILPNQYIVEVDCKNNPITVPDNCIIQAYGAELIFRNSDAGGYWADKMVDINNKKVTILGGNWWIDRAGSVDDDARRLFKLSNGAFTTFIGSTISNNTGREGIAAGGAGTRAVCIGCLFQPQQNTYTDNVFIMLEQGASCDVPGSTFDGFAVGTTTLRCEGGIQLYSHNSIESLVRGATFKHLYQGVVITLYHAWGADQGSVRICDCDFVDMLSSYLYPCIMLRTRTGTASPTYKLSSLIVESSRFSFKNGQNNGIFIGGYASYYNYTNPGSYPDAQYNDQIKHLVLRNLTLLGGGVTHGTLGTTGTPYIGILFNNYVNNLPTIAEVSDITVLGSFNEQDIVINSSIPVGKKSIIRET